jgi:hypothetical protein
MQKFQAMGADACRQLQLPAITADNLAAEKGKFTNDVRVKYLETLEKKVLSRYNIYRQYHFACSEFAYQHMALIYHIVLKIVKQ